MTPRHHIASAKAVALILLMLALGILLDATTTKSGHTDEHRSPYLLHPSITVRNVELAESIPTCSAGFPLATEEAIRIWNDATAAYTDAPLFVFQSDRDECTAESTDKLASVEVSRPAINPCSAAGLLCAQHTHYNPTLQTYTRKAFIHVVASYYTPSTDSATNRQLVRDLGHELGHVLGLSHYHCGYTPVVHDPGGNLELDHVALMNTDTITDACTVTAGGNLPRLTDTDLTDFLVAYYGVPKKPTALQATATNESLRITWEKPLIVRRGDRYQHRLDGGDWREMDLPNLQAETFDIETLTNDQEYVIELRVVRGPVHGGPSNPAYGTPRAPVTPVVISIQTTTISLEAGELTDIIWPGFATRVDIAIDNEDRISHAVWYDVANMVWRIYAKDAPEFLNTRFILRNGHAYGIWATVAFDWRVNIPAARSGHTGGQSGVRATSEQPGWVATVTCVTGLSPFVLGPAPARTVAEENAQWLVENQIGCAGDGTYRVEYKVE